MGNRHSNGKKTPTNSNPPSPTKSHNVNFSQINSLSPSSIHKETPNEIPPLQKPQKSMSGASTSSEQTTDPKQEANSMKIPTTFEWKEGGKSIFIIGSFSQWESKFPLAKLENSNDFKIVLLLPKGVYQFKFIVDGIWKCSKHCKIIKDTNNNFNNVISNLIEANINEIQTIKEDEEAIKEVKRNLRKRSDVDKDNEDVNDQKKFENAKRKMENLKEKKSLDNSYDTTYPKLSDFCHNAKCVPYLYQNQFSMNKHGGVAQVGSHLNKSFTEIKCPPHIIINHEMIRSNRNESFISVSSIFRVRRKFITIVYCQTFNPVKK